MEVKTVSEEQTKQVAARVAKTLQKGDVVALYGKLGAGKTIFTKGIAEGLGIKKRIISPTFTIVRSYNKEKIPFHHLDLYRGEKESDFESIGLSEIITKNSIAIIEWAQKIKKKLPKKRIDIKIKIIDEKTRLISIERLK